MLTSSASLPTPKSGFDSGWREPAAQRCAGDGGAASPYGIAAFEPQAPRTLDDSGLSDAFVDALIAKFLFIHGKLTGRATAEAICLPFGVIDERLRCLRNQQIVMHVGSAAVNDYTYSLTSQGKETAQLCFNQSAYLGPAPVPFSDYVISVEAQSITAEVPNRDRLILAFQDITVTPDLLDALGPAINSGSGLFLYGAPGNGKSTLATRITMCFGQHIWIPKSIIADGEVIKLFDPAYHEPVPSSESSLLMKDFDARWVKIRRPTVTAGGELTLDSLDIRHDPHARVSEAPLQMKSNCGSLLIDDFGRQRADLFQLLNRWIIPLENRYDFLQLATGKKIQVPFDQLMILSTNLDPTDLVDEAFLRRIPYKLFVPDPDREEFEDIFRLACDQMDIPFCAEAFEHLVATHYQDRPMRRCHPRDLLFQIQNYCRYTNAAVEMTPALLDRAVKSYFAMTRLDQR